MKVLAHQNLLDIALQECGSALACFDIAMANGLSVTDDLVPGQELSIANYPLSINADILGYYKKKEVQPATASPMIIQNNDYFFGLPYFLP